MDELVHEDEAVEDDLRTMNHCCILQNIRNPPKKNSIPELGVLFWGSPLFLALSGHSHVRGISTLNFGPFSTKLGGTVRAIKK